MERLAHIDKVNFDRAADYLNEIQLVDFGRLVGEAQLKFRDLNVFLASGTATEMNRISRARKDEDILTYFSLGFGMVCDMFFQKYEDIIRQRLKAGVPRWEKQPIIDELKCLYDINSPGELLDQHPAIEQVIDHLLKTVYTDEKHQKDFRIGAYIAHKSLGVLFQ